MGIRILIHCSRLMNKILLLFFCIFKLHAAAQTKYVPGYLVGNNADTLKIYLEGEYSSDLVKQVHYKKELTSKETLMAGPGEIRRFGYDHGSIYRSVSFVTQDGDSSESRSRFAVLMVSGLYNLLSYTENDETYYIIQEESRSFILYNTSYNPQGDIKRKGNYQDQLILLSVACEKKLKNPEQIDYKTSELIAFVESLNRCVAPEQSSVNYFQKSKPIVHPMLFAGGLPLGTPGQITAEAGLRISSAHISKKVSLNVGFHYSYTKLNSTYQPSWDPTTSFKVLQKDQIYSVPVTLQYNFLTWKIQPYFGAGFSITNLSETKESGYLIVPVNHNGWDFAFVAELGAEGYITRNLFIKAAWRYELLLQYPAIGVGWKF